MNTNTRINALRRFGQALGALAVAAGLGAFAPAAHAQSGSLSLGNGGSQTNCATFSGFSWSNGTLTVNCTAPVQSCDATAATTGFHVVNPSVSVTAGTQVNVTIQRDGGCAGSYTVSFSSGGFADPNQPGSMPTGWSVTPQNSVSFAQGDTTKTVSVATGTTAGLIGVWLTGAGAVTASGGESIYVTPPAPTTIGGGTGSARCGTANYVLPMQNNSNINFGTSDQGSNPALMPGQTVALDFTFNPPNGGGTVQLSPVINAVSNQGSYDTEISIANCAGSFQTSGSATNTPSSSLISADYCDVRIPGTTYAGQGISAISAGSAVYAGAFCKLNVGQQYYINIRQVPANSFTNNSPSCTDNTHGCTLRVQPNGLN